ncbi:MAG: phage holin family protein [Betaproteobacteria bacterium]|nr:phage holin family protein [Betaproteobacteria bacterium]
METPTPSPASAADPRASESRAGAASGGGTASDGASPGLSGLVQQLLGELPGLVSDRVHLLALELRRAAIALAWLGMLVVASGVLLCTAWLAIWAGIGWLLLQAGASPGGVCLLIVAANLLTTALLAGLAKRLARHVNLSATMRRLTLAPSIEPQRPATEAAVPAGAAGARAAS